MNNTLLIVCYLGEITTQVKKSICSLLNNDVDVMLFTDSSVNINKENFYYHYIDRKQIEELIIEFMGVSPDLSLSYKMCDFKPFYPLIFSSYLPKRYDYMGFCDVDVVYGDLSSFIISDGDKKMDVIGNRGHFMLFESMFYHSFVDKLLRSELYKNLLVDVFSSKYCYAFDEFKFLHKILSCYGLYHDLYWDVSVSQECVDLDYYKKYLYCYNRRVKIQRVIVSGGRIFINSQEEVPYMHFQKRNIDNQYFLNYVDTVTEYDFSCAECVGHKFSMILGRVKSKINVDSLFKKHFISKRLGFYLSREVRGW